MLVFVTHRRLKPGTFDQFRKAWEPDEMPEGVREVAYYARSTENRIPSGSAGDRVATMRRLTIRG